MMRAMKAAHDDACRKHTGSARALPQQVFFFWKPCTCLGQLKDHNAKMLFLLHILVQDDRTILMAA
jgi:hypothetical protein